MRPVDIPIDGRRKKEAEFLLQVCDGQPLSEPEQDAIARLLAQLILENMVRVSAEVSVEEE